MRYYGREIITPPLPPLTILHLTVDVVVVFVDVVVVFVVVVFVALSPTLLLISCAVTSLPRLPSYSIDYFGLWTISAIRQQTADSRLSVRILHATHTFHPSATANTN